MTVPATAATFSLAGDPHDPAAREAVVDLLGAVAIVCAGEPLAMMAMIMRMATHLAARTNSTVEVLEIAIGSLEAALAVARVQAVTATAPRGTS